MNNLCCKQKQNLVRCPQNGKLFNFLNGASNAVTSVIPLFIVHTPIGIVYYCMSFKKLILLKILNSSL